MSGDGKVMEMERKQGERKNKEKGLSMNTTDNEWTVRKHSGVALHSGFSGFFLCWNNKTIF
jgi:hypothetical protein